MTNPWLVSPFLADLLGADVLAQLDDIDPLSTLTCQVCGKVKPAGDPGPLAVIAGATGDGTVVVGLAHPGCRDKVGDLWPGLAGRVEGEEGLDALALFGIRTGVRPRAVLAFEPQVFGRALLGGGEGIDPYVAGHLEVGFTLMTEPLTDIAPPLAPGWVIDTRGGQITLRHSEIGIGYTQPTTAEAAEWLRMARGEGRCLVVTGTGLHIDPANPLPADFRTARLRGLAVAATVKVR